MAATANAGAVWPVQQETCVVGGGAACAGAQPLAAAAAVQDTAARSQTHRREALAAAHPSPCLWAWALHGNAGGPTCLAVMTLRTAVMTLRTRQLLLPAAVEERFGAGHSGRSRALTAGQAGVHAEQPWREPWIVPSPPPPLVPRTRHRYHHCCRWDSLRQAAQWAQWANRFL